MSHLIGSARGLLVTCLPAGWSPWVLELVSIIHEGDRSVNGGDIITPNSNLNIQKEKNAESNYSCRCDTG